MWKLTEPGVAHWRDGDTFWNLDTRGDQRAITIAGRDRGHTLASLNPVGDDRLPSVSESFVRGNEWHLRFPQGTGSYALSLVIKPIESSASRLILEVTVSIQTDRLDLHPTIDLVVPGDGLQVWTPTEEAEAARRSVAASSPGASCLTGVVSTWGSATVLLGRRDYPWTLDLSDDQTIRLRLFGEFLEKGVIRKARPWLCLERSVTDIDEQAMIERWRELESSPLPLTA